MRYISSEMRYAPSQLVTACCAYLCLQQQFATLTAMKLNTVLLMYCLWRLLCYTCVAGQQDMIRKSVPDVCAEFKLCLVMLHACRSLSPTQLQSSSCNVAIADWSALIHAAQEPQVHHVTCERYIRKCKSLCCCFPFCMLTGQGSKPFRALLVPGIKGGHLQFHGTGL